MSVEEFLNYLSYHVGRKSVKDGKYPLTIDLETIIKMVDEIEVLTPTTIKEWINENL